MSAHTAPTGSGLGIPHVYSRAAAADLRRTCDNAVPQKRCGADSPHAHVMPRAPVTDPTFDPPGECQLRYTTLTKTAGPALSADRIMPVDALLISHDQHALSAPLIRVTSA
jgi:hypothetical protein